MRAMVLCTVAAAGATLLISSGAQATPPIGSALSAAVRQQATTEQVRCRGHKCYVSRRHYDVSRPHVGSEEPSAAWQYSPLNNPYYWGSGVR
jgi:hypothetical protein